MISNALANILGKFWGILSNFIFLPLYIHYLGFENYSIIAFTLILTSIMSILDVGLTSTLSRELASVQNSNKEKFNIFNTLETFYFFIVIASITIVFSLSNYLSSNWINLTHINPDAVSYYIKIVSFGIGLEIILRFYIGGLLGLEKQVLANKFIIAWGILRNGLIVIPIYFFPSLEIFFLWQTFSVVIFVFMIRFSLLKLLSDNNSIYKFLKIDTNVLKNNFSFALSMFLIALVAAINTQMDRIFLSKLLPLEILGFYTIAFSISRIINVVVHSLNTANLPKLTSLFTSNKQHEAIEIFNLFFKIITIFIISFGSIMILYGEEIIFVWTNNLELASNTAAYIPYIILGTSALAFQGLFYNIAIANKFMIYNNVIGISSLIITVPLYFFLIEKYGGIGAGLSFSITQIIILLIYSFMINKKFIRKNSFAYLLVILGPIIFSAFFLFITYYSSLIQNDRGFILFYILLIFLILLIINTLMFFSFKKIKSMVSILRQELNQ
mgnify:CR=1 FL=1